MLRRFRDYVFLREGREDAAPQDDETGDERHADRGILHTSMVLGKGNDFKPFVVASDSRNPHFPKNKNLGVIVAAFRDSRKVKVYDSIGKGGTPKPHTLAQKSLYLVGGAVRDHLLGKTPHDIDLATDASPDEIRMILLNADFLEVGKDRSSKDREGDKVFYVKGRDKGGADFVFGVKVRGQEFELATFRKDSHGSDGRHPDYMTFGDHADDAARRDLTINSLYLLLGNADGPNSQLTDFHGGVHDLAAGRVRFVGDAKDRLGEDLLRALRYARFAARFGDGHIEPEIERAVVAVAPQIRSAVSPERIQQEFVKGLENEDTDPVKLLAIYKRLGLMDALFPGMVVKMDSLDDIPQDRDPAVVVASLLRGNHPAKIRKGLADGRWSSQDIDRVSFLHSILNMNARVSPDDLNDHLNNYNRSGIMGKSVARWWRHNRRNDPETLNAFLDFAKGPRIRTTTIDDETGESRLDPDFAPLFDPISEKPLAGVGKEIGDLRKRKEHRAFATLLGRYAAQPDSTKL